MVSSNAGSASALTLMHSCFFCMRWGLRFGSDIRKYSTDAGLAPFPARWDVRIKPTVSVITFAVEIHAKVII